MTRAEALAVLRRLAAGLGSDAPGCARLLERVSQTADPEALRDVLTDLGAVALIRDGHTAPWFLEEGS